MDKLPEDSDNVWVRFEDGTKGVGYYESGHWWIYAPQDNEWAESHLFQSAPYGIWERICPTGTPVSEWAKIRKTYVPKALWNDAANYVKSVGDYHSVAEIDALISLLGTRHTERGDILANELASWKETK